MAKRRDPNTLDLLAWEPPAVAVGYAADVAGRGPLDNKIARVVARALRDARDDRDLDRVQVAARMSDYLERAISKTMIDKWSGEGSTEHRIPLDAFIALIHVTAAHDLLGFVPAIFGMAVMPEKYAELVELHLLEEHEQEVAARKAALAARWKARR